MEIERMSSVEKNEEVEEDEEVALPGFRFHPTDEELVGFYLRRKVEKKRLSIDVINQVDIYKFDPWDLAKQTTVSDGENKWYFFCLRGRKYRNSVRPNRVTGSGYWKATGIDKKIIFPPGTNNCIGLKKSLVYYCGKGGKGTKTYWMMHEFRLPPKGNELFDNPKTINSDDAHEADSETMKGSKRGDDKSMEKCKKSLRVNRTGVTANSTSANSEVVSRQSASRRTSAINTTKHVPKSTGAVFTFKSDERAENRKEYNMKLEEKLLAKEAKMSEMQGKSQNAFQKWHKAAKKRHMTGQSTSHSPFISPGASPSASPAHPMHRFKILRTQQQHPQHPQQQQQPPVPPQGENRDDFSFVKEKPSNLL